MHISLFTYFVYFLFMSLFLFSLFLVSMYAKLTTIIGLDLGGYPYAQASRVM